MFAQWGQGWREPIGARSASVVREAPLHPPGAGWSRVSVLPPVLPTMPFNPDPIRLDLLDILVVVAGAVVGLMTSAAIEASDTFLGTLFASDVWYTDCLILGLCVAAV